MTSMSQRPRTGVFIYEYAWRPDDAMMPELIASWTQAEPGLRHRYVHGAFLQYVPGGLHPRRLANLVVVYARVFADLVFRRSDFVLVRTTPPGVQLWTVLWARLRGIPVVCWLMDYHPELEARALEHRGVPLLPAFLRWLDGLALRRMALIVTLDQAMADLCRSRCGSVPVLRHPTWGAAGSGVPFQRLAREPGSDPDRLRLVYGGSLGAAHGTDTLELLLRHLARLRPVELHIVGSSPGAVARFRAIGERTGVQVLARDRVPYVKLGELFAAERLDAGIVLLNDASSGLVSPSKFSGYVNFGLPVISIGPPGTNADAVCSEFGGGFALRNGADEATVAATAAALAAPGGLASTVAGVERAAAHFLGLGPSSLATLLRHHLAPQPART